MKSGLRQLASIIGAALATDSTVRTAERIWNTMLSYTGTGSLVLFVASFEASSMLPEIVSSGRSTTDYVTDTFFSEAEKVPFSQEERQAVTLALQKASERIKEQFQTTPEQQTEIEQKLEYLSRKVKELDKFNWKRLLITTLVGISVDLGFGTFIPSALLAAFTEVLSHVVEKYVGRTKSLPGSA